MPLRVAHRAEGRDSEFRSLVVALDECCIEDWGGELKLEVGRKVPPEVLFLDEPTPGISIAFVLFIQPSD